jgi:pyruvate/2-oxoglutarate/acetoin dehydrogenase E1 component
MPAPTTAEAIRDALRAALTDDPSVVLLGEGVGRSGGAGGSSAGLQNEHPARVLDLPIADRANVGFALGLAIAGKRVVVELAGTGRLAALLEVLGEAGAVSAGEFASTLVIRVPYGSGVPGLDAPVGRWLTALPGVRVVCPSSPAMAAGLLRQALGRSGPTVILEPRDLYGERGSTMQLEPHLRRQGQHVTLAAWGQGVEPALAAAEALAGEGIEADVLDLVSLAPLDRTLLGARVRATGRLVVVHPDDHALARQVREVALDEAFLYLEAPLADAPASGDPTDAIARAARGAVHY